MIFDDDRNQVRFLPGRHRAAGVSRRTWRRWMNGEARIPPSVVALARILAGGSLDELHADWSGWRINRRTGELVDLDTGIAHSPQSVRAWHWCAQELRALRGEENQENIRRLKTGNDGAALTRELHRRIEKN